MLRPRKISSEVSAAFISRVRARERAFTIESLTQLETLLAIPLGALLLAAVPIPQARGKMKDLQELAKRAIAQADIAAATIRSRTAQHRPK